MADTPLPELISKLKRSVIAMTEAAGGGYVSQGIGSAELFAALFFRLLRLDPTRPEWEHRDRFLLSVGHYAIGAYAAMGQLGYFTDEQLLTYSADGSLIEMIGTEATPGFEITGGSLSQGLSQGIGLAMAAKLRKYPWRTVVFMSDGELEEGQTWEAAMVASHHKLDQLLVIVDINGMQADGPIGEVTGILPIPEKWQAFGWNVHNLNGHDTNAILDAFSNSFIPNGKPTVILANTVVGNGISFLHGRTDVHYLKWAKEQSEQALDDLSGGEATLV